jgi:hypothetical protein
MNTRYLCSSGMQKQQLSKVKGTIDNQIETSAAQEQRKPHAPLNSELAMTAVG